MVKNIILTITHWLEFLRLKNWSPARSLKLSKVKEILKQFLTHKHLIIQVKYTFLTVHSGNNGQIFKTMFASNGNWIKNKYVINFIEWTKICFPKGKI